MEYIEVSLEKYIFNKIDKFEKAIFLKMASAKVKFHFNFANEILTISE